MKLECLFQKLDKMLKVKPVILAIDGGSASGKTTLSKIIQQQYDCTVFHMDDFFLRPEQRTEERYNQPGGNVDRERFLEEVLVPLKEKKIVYYRRFDCKSCKLLDPVEINPKSLVVVEGAYSMHPELAVFYDFSVFLEISPELQKERIRERNSPCDAKRFWEKWIPLEEVYFSKFEIKEKCDVVISDLDWF